MFTGCLADSLMYMPSLCQKYSNHIHQLVTLNLKDDTSLVRNTCYLLGVFCENLGDSAGAQYTEYLTLLYPVFQSKVD